MNTIRYDNHTSAALPREKAVDMGIAKLSDRELFALLIGSGTRERNIFQIAEETCTAMDRQCEDNLDSSKEIPQVLRSLMAIPGVGTAKGLLIAAALELGRRRYGFRGSRITCPDDVWPLLRYWGDRKQEHFFVLCLNGAHSLVDLQPVTTGLLNRSLVHPREVFAPAIAKRAAAIIVAHNHPSGVLDPSREDSEVTVRLKDAGDILGIPLLDHLIFSSESYISMREAGMSVFD